MAEGLIPVRVPWTSQPPYNAPIDRSNPYSRGLSFVWTPHGSNLGPGSNTGMPIGGTEHGLATRGTATDGELITIPDHDALSGAINGSVMYLTIVRSRGHVDQGSGTNEIFTKGTEWALRLFNTEVFSCLIGGTTQSFGAADDGEWHTIVGLGGDRPSASDRTGVILDGTFIGENSGGSYSPSTEPLIIGSTDTARNADADIALILFWNRGWWNPDTDFPGARVTSQLQGLINNPWQIFQPRTLYIPVGVADVVGGRIMSSLVRSGGLVGQGGIAGEGGGLAG